MKNITFATVSLIIAGVWAEVASASCASDLLKQDKYSLEQVVGCVVESEKAATGISSGAVLAFDLKSSCPAGWVDVGTTDFERFAGRAIIAAGPRVDRPGEQTTLRRSFDDQGGVEQILLGVPNLPPHSFSVTVKTVGFGGDMYEAGGNDYHAVGSSEAP